MKNQHKSRIRFSLLATLVTVAFLATAQSLLATPPSAVQVMMYRLNADGSRYNPTQGVYYPCATAANQDKYGCTAFAAGVSTPVTVVLYPYGETPAPQVSLETDYLKNVLPAEMSISIAPDAALEAQAIAARSYGWNKNSNLDNSTQSQVFIPYKFEYLQVVQGDYAHNPTTTPTPNLGSCASITPIYQRTVCNALDSTSGKYLTAHDVATPAFAEFSLDAYLKTTPGSEAYLQSVDDPISYDPAIATVIIPTNQPHQRGMSQNGAMRWAHGNSSKSGSGTPWSVTWNYPEQILTHYYTGIDIRDSSGNVLTPPLRWNMLNAANLPDSMTASASEDISVTIQNTGAETWNENVSTWAWSLSYQWCAQDDQDCPIEDSEYWWNNGELPETAPGASLDAEVWLDAPANAGTYRLVLDVCKYFPPMRAQSSPEPQRVNSPEGWTCFGLQNPVWQRFEKVISVGS